MAENKKVLKREQVNKDYTWKLEDLYEDDSVWENDYNILNKQLNDLKKFKGTLSRDSQSILSCLKYCDALSVTADKLYVYANMKFHEDSTNTFYQNLSNKAEQLIINYSSAASYIVPEIINISEEKLNGFLEESNELKTYSHFLDNIIRQKNHTLSEKEENILAKTSELSNASQNIFSMINEADMKFPNILDEHDEEIELTKGRYITFLESTNREVRKNAFINFYKTYLKQKNTIAATYYENVKKDVFYAKIRNYPSSLEHALNDDKIPTDVYSNLIETVNNNLHLMHRYIALRKKLLNVDELHMYDLYTPLVQDLKMKITYAEAKETVLKGLSPLGNEYVENLKNGFNNRWIDVYENEGKRGGAYSWGTYSSHPFVLLNHNDTINSMFTIAHEMGHALHSFYTWETQPYIYSGHKIFAAEVASTVNEALLMEYMLKNTTDIKAKKYLINYFMEQFRGTLFRQTMFAEFEKTTHEMVENGEPLNVQNLNELYRNLNIKYFGNDIVIDEYIDFEWARIPHFYNAFYVYQYATGYSAAITLSRKILNEGTPAINNYLNFLKTGNSDYSINLLKNAGVDMETPYPVEQAMKVFEGLINTMENL